MVLGTVTTVGIICTSVAVVPAFVASASAAAVLGGSAGAGAAGVGTASAIGTAVGAATSTGAIAGAVATVATSAGAGAVASGAAVGGLTGASAAVGASSMGTGLGALWATAGAGGWGIFTVGASVNQEYDEISYDCWKPVVHDTSPERSDGMLLKDMICHPNVANVTMTTGICDSLPSIIIENIWDEKFEIEYVFIHDSGKIACHAKPL